MEAPTGFIGFCCRAAQVDLSSEWKSNDRHGVRAIVIGER